MAFRTAAPILLALFLLPAPASAARVLLDLSSNFAAPTLPTSATDLPGLWLAGTAFDVPARALLLRMVAGTEAPWQDGHAADASALSLRWLDSSATGTGPAAWRIRTPEAGGPVRLDLWTALAEGFAGPWQAHPVVHLNVIDGARFESRPSASVRSFGAWELALFAEPSSGLRFTVVDDAIAAEPVPLPGAIGLLWAGLLVLFPAIVRRPVYPRAGEALHPLR